MRKLLFAASILFLLPVSAMAAEVKSSSVETAAIKAPAPVAKKVLSSALKEEKSGEEKKKEKFVEKTVTGTVIFIRKDKMSVEIAGGEGDEVLFTVDDKVKLSNAKSLSDIHYGVTVRVTYKEVFLDPEEEGGRPTILKRAVKEIKFIKPAGSSTSAMEGSDEA